MTPLIEGMRKAIAMLKEHDVVPSSFEITRATYEKLRSECRYPCTDKAPDHFMGVKIVVKD